MGGLVMRAGKRKWDRTAFEAVTHKEALTVSQIIEMHAKGVIKDNDYLFTIDGIKTIGQHIYKGAQANCRDQKNPKSRWSKELTWADANEMIRDAFTT